jgi:hypothetical protein
MGITLIRRAAATAGFVLSSISIISVPGALHAQAVVRGVLYDDVSGLPLRGTVMLVDPATNATVVYVATDSAGWFNLRTRDGTYQISAVRGGYTSVLSAPIPLQNGELMTIRVPIAENGDPQHHIGVVEHVRASGAASAASPAYGPRTPRATRLGLHYDRAQLEKSNAGTLAEFLQTVPGMAVANSRSSASIQTSRSAGMSTPEARGLLGECHLGWFVDGQRWDVPGRSDPSVDALASTQLSGIEMLEVFRGLSEMPTELATPDLRCGAVAIWTRRR